MPHKTAAAHSGQGATRPWNVRPNTSSDSPGLTPGQASVNLAAVRGALRARAEDIARHYLDEPNRTLSSRAELRFGSHGSLSVHIAGDKAGCWYDHEAGVGGDLLALIQRVLGCGFSEAIDQGARYLCGPPMGVSAASGAATASDVEKTARALRLWRGTRSPYGTVVERYLANRGLALPPEAAGEAIRYHRDCPFGREARTPCMVALVRDIRTDEPIGVHRTAIAPGGLSAAFGGVSRKSLGPISGGVVKLTPDAEVETVIAIGEGLESSLSIRVWRGCETLPVWAALSAGGLAAFPLLPGVEVLWIAADNDQAGMAAVDRVRARWNAAGRDVEIVRPRAEGQDLNDLVRRRRA